MTTATMKRERLTIDVMPEEHRKIKVCATLQGKTIREYILEIVRERLRMEEEERQLSTMATNIGPVLKELWDNEKDAAYDKL